MAKLTNCAVMCIMLTLVLIGLPAISFAQDSDVLATGPASSSEQGNITVPPEHPASYEKTVTVTEDEPTERPDWSSWSDSDSIDDVHKDDELKF